MNLRSGKWVCSVALAISLASCSKSPEKYLASGDKYFKAGKYNEAILQYQNALQRNSRLTSAHFQLAKAYLVTNSLQAAFKELQRTVDLEPGNAEAQLQLATLLLGAKRFDEAKAIMTKVLAASPNNAEAHALLGNQLAITSDLPGAIREYQAAIKLDSHQVATYASLATVHLARGEMSEAETVFKQAVNTNPQSLPARLNLSRFYLSQKKFDAAEAELSAASRMAPHDPSPRLALADAYIVKGNLAAAEKVCSELKTIAPEDERAYHALASFYDGTRQPEKLIAELQSLRASKPKDSWVRQKLAQKLLDLNRVKEAVGPVDELQAMDPGDPRELILRGRILLAERKYPEARAALEKAIKAAPKSTDAYYFLGVAQSALGLADAAKASFAQAHKLAPRILGPEAALAELDANRGHFEEAERLAKTYPNEPTIETIGARAELAKGNLRKAEQMVQVALEREPAYLPALDILIDVYLRDGKTQEAVRRLSALISESPKNPGLHFLLARVYFQQKDFAKSEASARQALVLDPQTPDAHALLGTIDAAKGLGDLAVSEFKAEIEAYPNKASTYLALSSLYSAQGKWQDQINTLEKARTVDSSSPYVKNDLAFLYLEHGKDPNVALSLAQEAKSGMPNSPVVADTLGWAFYKVGSYEPAIAQLSIANQKLPDKAPYQYHLGMAYLGAGRLEPAAQSLQRALKIDATFADAGNAKAALDTIARRSKK